MFDHSKSSNFYSSYDARELVTNRQYKGIEFPYGEMGDGFVVESEDEVIEQSKSISYGCRIQTKGDAAFKIADFLSWLLEETAKEIESAKGTVRRRSLKVGRRFLIEYTQAEFSGRVEVYADLEGNDQMSLEVEVIESRRK